MKIKSDKYHIITNISNTSFHLYDKRNFVKSLHELLLKSNITIRNLRTVYTDLDFRISPYKNCSYYYRYNNFKDAVEQSNEYSEKLLALHRHEHGKEVYTYNGRISCFGDIERYNDFIRYYNKDYNFK